MDPTVTAAVTAAATMLGTEVAKGMAGEAAKDLWSKIKRTLGFKHDPRADKIEEEVRGAITTQPETLKELLLLLQSHQNTPWGQMVGQINADKVVVLQGKIDQLNM